MRDFVHIQLIRVVLLIAACRLWTKLIHTDERLLLLELRLPLDLTSQLALVATNLATAYHGWQDLIPATIVVIDAHGPLQVLTHIYYLYKLV